MQSWREQGSVSQLDPLPPSFSLSLNGNRSEYGGGGGRDELGKWRTRYEEAMNPFEAFHGRVCVKCLAFWCAGLMIVKPDLAVRK
jgi:homeobox protein cut-like